MRQAEKGEIARRLLPSGNLVWARFEGTARKHRTRCEPTEVGQHGGRNGRLNRRDRIRGGASAVDRDARLGIGSGSNVVCKAHGRGGHQA